MKKYFTPHEIADMCQVSKGSVIRWIKEGKLKTAMTGGGHHRVWIDDLILFLNTLNMVIPEHLKDKVCGKKKILAIEDDAALLGFLREFFKKNFPDTEFFEAVSGFEAGLAISRIRPDLVLLDLVLPGVDGFKICEDIRRQPEWRFMKILVMTGLDDDVSRKRVLALGADDFLAKPFDSKVFREKIITHLGVETRGGQASSAA